MRRELREAGFYIQPPYIGWDYVARVASAGRSLMTIQVTSESGDIPPIVGEVAYIGTSPRQWDIGITRIRSYTTGIIGVAENEIEWNTNLWVWCPRTFAPMAKIQRVASDSGRPMVWMDYDITPRPLPPKVNVAGPLVVNPTEINYYYVTARAMEANASIGSPPSSVQAYPDGSVSVNGWEVAVSFPTSGSKIIIVSVTDSNGQTGRRIVPIVCGVPPTERVILESVSWQLNGGFRFDVRMPMEMMRPLQAAIFRFGPKFVQLWQIEPEEDFTPDARMMRVVFLSALAMADKLISHSMLLEDGARDSWYRIPGLNARRAIHMMLEFHSTLNENANIVYLSNRMELPIHSQQFHEGSLLGQVAQLAKDCLSAGFEEFDNVVYFREEACLVSDRSSFPRHTIEPIGQVRETANEPIGRLQAGGFAYQTPYLSRWPGTTPEIWRPTDDVKGLVVADQDDLNRAAGMLASYRQANDLSFPVAEAFDWLPPFSTIWESTITGEVQPLRMQARMDGGVNPLVEVSVKRITPQLIGETIEIPTEPVPPPVEFPPPPPIEPPPSMVTGYAFIRCEHYIVRTPQIYSEYPHWEVICSASNYPHPYDPNHVTTFVDFRYIEAPGGAVIIAALSSGYIIRCNNPTADDPAWETIATPSLFAPTSAYRFTIGPLMTMVQDYRHIGVFASVDPGNYYVSPRYFYSNDFGASWDSSPIRSNILVWHPAIIADGTAGTNQITAHLTWAGGSATAVYQSNNRGESWVAISDGFRDFISPDGRIRKPWQYGTSGRTFYVCGFFGSGGPDFICGKSTDNLDSATETFNISGHNSTVHGMEVWTFNEKEVHVITRNNENWWHAVTFTGGSTWNVTYHGVETFGVPNVSLRGNPANNKEWTFVLEHSIDPGQNPPIRPIIYQTLDGGKTFDDLTGDWWDSGLGNEIGARPRDFLIIPPFVVKSRREP